MSLARHPRRFFAASVALVLVCALFVPAAIAGGSQPPARDGSVPWWVDWLEAFDSNDNRIDDEAEAIAARRLAAGKPNALVPVLVSFARKPVDAGALLAHVGAARDAYVFKTQPLVDLNVPAQNLSRLATAPGVVAVEYDRPLYPMLNVGAPAIQANNGSGTNTFYNGRTAEDLGYTGEGMVVAVLDTGVQDAHAAFAGGKWIAGTDVSPQVPVGTCFNPPDDEGHGTHVASTAIGASGAQLGTAKAAKLVEVKIAVGGATATIGPATIGSTNRGFEFVKLYNDRLAAGNPLCGTNDDHIDVATLSFGSLGRGGPNAGSTETFIDALANSGVAVTVAVGNCGPSASATCTFTDDDNGISSPGNAAGAIGVASFFDRNTVNRGDDAISAFSSRGPNNGTGDTAAGGATSASNLKDRYRKPDVAAPGEGITSAGPVPFTSATLSGTSMATPHVAGVAALLLQAGEQAKDQTGGVNLMASTGNGFVSDGYTLGRYPVRDALVHAAEYKEEGAKSLWTGPNSLGRQWNNAWGYGQTNAFAAICWAWDNVLVPGGAAAPVAVTDGCGLGGGGGDPTPDPTATPTPSPEPSNGISIVDPFGDANYLNGQGVVGGVNNQTAGNVWASADIGEVWFTHTPDTVSAHIQTREPTPGDAAFFFRVQVDPGSGTPCLWFQAATTGAGDVNMGNNATLRDTCTTAVPTSSGTISFANGPDGTGITTVTFPRTAHPALGAGKMLRGPVAHSRHAAGATAPPPGGTSSATAPQIDDTVAGLGYTLTGPGPQPTATPTPSGTATSSASPTPTPSGGPGTYPLTPNDPYFGSDPTGPTDFDPTQWAPRKIRAPQAWQEQQATGHGINVAIIDSGLDLGHPDFDCDGKIATVPGADAVRDGDGPQDVDGHGTHVAGIIGACTNNGVGIAGVAPDSTLMPIQVFSSDPNYDGDGDNNNVDDLADAIRLAADSGAHVINMSLSFGISPIPGTGILGSQYEYTNIRTIPTGIREAIKYAQEKGVVVVAAAGNDTTLPICDYPAVAKDVICVGATDPRDVRTWYTNGANKPQTNGTFGPAVMAPGGTEALFCDLHAEHILSTYSRAQDACDEGLAGYRTLNGTSMASPHVAAVAALVYDRLAGERTAANALTVIDAITSSAVDLGVPGYDPVFAYGRVDALSAVTAVDPVLPPTAADTTVTFTGDNGGRFSDDARIAARLVDDTGAPIQDAELIFEMTGEDGTQEWSENTGPDGVAAVTRHLDRAPGTYNLTARFAGQAGVYRECTEFSFFFIEEELTVTTLNVSGKGKNRTMTATLAEDDGPSLGQQEIVFFADETEIGRAMTDGNGVVTFRPPNEYRGDHFLFEARFAGDGFYARSSGSDQT